MIPPHVMEDHIEQVARVQLSTQAVEVQVRTAVRAELPRMLAVDDATRSQVHAMIKEEITAVDADTPDAPSRESPKREVWSTR